MGIFQHPVKTNCKVYAAHIKISDIDARAASMIKTIKDTSWIDTLPVIQQVTFEATSRRTIEALVRCIKCRIVKDNLTTDFGEYLVSETGQEALEIVFSHSKVPLAELLKEKVTGNPGFDFHSETKSKLISFGEAKYSGAASPYNAALKQIKDFVVLGKDNAELNMLQHFVCSNAMESCIGGDKSYAAAFSINHGPDRTFINAIRNKHMKELLVHKEVYLIGVEIDDSKLD
jgi:hypothetical protein